MKKKVWIILGIVVAVLGVGAWFLFGKKPEAKIEWKTSKVEMGDLRVTVTASGTVNADTVVQVGTQVSGIISKMFVDFNSRVKKGQVIAILDTTALAASVEEASANLFRNQVAVNQQKRNYDRTKQLFEQKVAAQADYDQALSDYETAQANLRSAKSNYNRAMINLKYATIVAPVSGVVVSRAVDVGQTVAASFSTPTLFAIANDLTKMQVQASIDEADIGKIREGQEVTFTVDAYDDQAFEGTVRQIRLQPSVTQNVVKYTVIISVPNPDLKLMPGMTANITVKIQEAKDILKVAASALRFWPSQEYLDKNLKLMPDSVQKFITRMMELRKKGGMQGAGNRGAGNAGQNQEQRQVLGGPGGGVSPVPGQGTAGSGRGQGMRQGNSQRPPGMTGTGASESQGGPNGGRKWGRANRGIVWVKQGELILPVRVQTGITDGSVTEVAGNLKEGEEVITGIVTTDASKNATQQQNPFAPQMTRPGSGRGGR